MDASSHSAVRRPTLFDRYGGPVALFRGGWGAAIAAPLACALVLYATAFGVGLSPDSVAYVGAARNLADGRGYTLPYGGLADGPLRQFPPLYSALLAGAGAAAGDPLVAARWVQALLFACNILLVARAVASMSPAPRWLPWLSAAFFTLGGGMLELHSMAWSEGLFLALTLLSFLALAAAASRRTWAALLAAGLLAGAACMARFAGVAVVAAGSLALLLLWRASLLRRLGAAALYAVLGVAPLALWLASDLLRGGQATGRQVAVHLFSVDHARSALTTVAAWLGMPPEASGIMKLAAVLLLAVAGAGIWWQRRSQTADTFAAPPIPPLAKLLALFVAVYALFLVVSISFVDANTPLDNRILAPIYAAGVALAGYAFGDYWRRAAGRSGIRRGMLAGALLLLAIHVLPAAMFVQGAHASGLGFSARDARLAALESAVRELPDQMLIFSNSPEAVYIGAGRRAQALPKKFLAMQQNANPDYTAALRQITDAVADGEAAVVLFERVSSRNLPAASDLEAAGIAPILKTPGGALYGAASASAP